MTVAYPPNTPSHYVPRGERLAREEVRRGLTALLRRRIPEQDVEDITQTVLADALASSTFPTDPEELRRWLTGIARHKIADFHRRSARQNARTNADIEPEFIAAKSTSFEEREVLTNVLNETRTHRDEQTMEWMVREHGGERLADIADENNLPAPVVRQRVSRLRRALRSRYAGVFALVAIIAGLSAVSAVIYNGKSDEALIAPDPSAVYDHPKAPASSTPVPSSLLKEVEGDWVVQAVNPNRALTPAEQKIVDLQAKTAGVTIHGKTVELHSGTFKLQFRVLGTKPGPNGITRVELESSEGNMKDTADVIVKRDAQGPRLEVRLHGPKFGGSVTLRRPIL